MVRMLSVLALALSLGGCSVFGGKAAEEPGYTVERAEGAFEIRRYPPLTVARTRVDGAEYGPAVRTGFGRLFDYISGENTGSTEIAMTAPVLTEPQGTEIAMTAPVLTDEIGDGWEVIFVLPEGMTREAAPVPTNPEVEIAVLPARRVGVARFSGFLSAKNIDRNRTLLAEWLASSGEAPSGDWQAAGYNPPWTIPAMRRNEVIAQLSN